MGSLQYVPFADLGAQPNIIVDGAANNHTVLTLSHWPKSGTPTELKRDASAEIVMEFLERGGRERYGITAQAVSNNHFEEDGLLGVWTTLWPRRSSLNRRERGRSYERLNPTFGQR